MRCLAAFVLALSPLAAMADGPREAVIDIVDHHRKKLNLDRMRPNLTFLSPDGGPVHIVELDKALHQNSIRHLAAGPTGVIAFAMQWEGDPFEAPPLLGVLDTGDVRLLETKASEQRRLKGYAGSIAVSADGAKVAITAPRGGSAHVFSLTTGGLMEHIRQEDICGVAKMGKSDFMFTTGLGRVFRSGFTMQQRHTVA